MSKRQTKLERNMDNIDMKNCKSATGSSNSRNEATQREDLINKSGLNISSLEGEYSDFLNVINIIYNSCSCIILCIFNLCLS